MIYRESLTKCCRIKKSWYYKQGREQEGKRTRTTQDTLLEGIGKGITGLSDGLLKGLAALRDKGMGAFGLIAGIIAAPVVAITVFIKLLLSSKFCQRC